MLNNKLFLNLMIFFSFSILAMEKDENKNANELKKSIYTEFMTALKKLDYSKIENILLESPNLVNHQMFLGTNRFNTYPIFYALESGDEKLFDILISYKNLDLNVVDGIGHSPLMYAMKNNLIYCVKILIEKNININKSGRSGITALFQAIINQNRDIVKLLISNGADVNGYIIDNKFIPGLPIYPKTTCLMHACEKGDLEIVRLLLNARNINLSIKDNKDMNDLEKNYFQVKEEFGQTAIDYAKDPKIKELMQNRLNKDQLKKELFETIKNKDINKFKELAQKVTSAVYDENGNNPLHYAIQAGDENIVALILIANPGLICQKNDKGQLPMELAAGKTEIFQNLKKLNFENTK